MRRRDSAAPRGTTRTGWRSECRKVVERRRSAMRASGTRKWTRGCPPVIRVAGQGRASVVLRAGSSHGEDRRADRVAERSRATIMHWPQEITTNPNARGGMRDAKGFRRWLISKSAGGICRRNLRSWQWSRPLSHRRFLCREPLVCRGDVRHRGTRCGRQLTA